MSRSQDRNRKATVLVHAPQHKKLMTECQVLRVQSGPSLKAAAKGRRGEARSTNIPLHPTKPRRKFNAFNENGLPLVGDKLIGVRNTATDGRKTSFIA
jgi:hypothetical protein